MPNRMFENQCCQLLSYGGMISRIMNLLLCARLNIVTCSRIEAKLANYFVWAAAAVSGLVAPSLL